jgi:hypothetical protein
MKTVPVLCIALCVGLGVATDQLKSAKMIEAVAAFLGLISAGIFVAHAVEAYAHAEGRDLANTASTAARKT